jgi:hypothetical protein
MKRSYSQAKDFKQAIIRRQPGITLYYTFPFHLLCFSLCVSFSLLFHLEINDWGDG